MDREALTAKIEALMPDLDLTIMRASRFKKKPLKALSFYTKVAVNRFTPVQIPIRATTLWDHTLTAYETSAIGSVFFLGFYDVEVTLFLLKYYRSEGDILDVGANIGVYTSLFSHIAHPQARVTAFEPTPSTYALLIQNTATLSNVTTERIALSDHAGSETFHDYGPRHGVFNSTRAQSLPFLAHTGSKIEVSTETLDGWCSRTGTKPTLIKLDTEGTEARILRHAGATLDTHRPLILLEVGGGEAWSKNNVESLNILAEHGYVFFSLTQHGDPIPHERKTSYTYENLIAIHTSNVSAYAAHT
jgi:FkbM family methyltransferase